MSEFDPALVEKGAAAIKAVINDGQSRRHRNVHEEFSRAVLSAVADDLRCNVNHTKDRAEAYAIGRSEGARQVLAAVEALGDMDPPGCHPVRPYEFRAAAREAVARIEGGA